ncbi:RING finger protein 17 isoform X1 [Corythoichthys intestinalis]|uniref:RING finger protein 17 isoform X1 n=2 Tax=Corythoichthys intestinalis TaxID=161448 RepID=UPI0025A4D453|nr:RING finger protein 17 isoform X1 [Corythoichthys intestinalis]
MQKMEQPNDVICNFCENEYTLTDNEVESNLPRILICGHIFCTTCLQSMEFENAVKCPDCEVESILPEEGVYGLQEDTGIIGLIYSAKMKKMRWSDTSKRGSSRRGRATSSDISCTLKDMEQLPELEKVEKAMDEAMTSAKENLAKLKVLHQTLIEGLEKQMKKEEARLEKEINRATDKAINVTRKWGQMQLSQLSGLQLHFSSTHAEICKVKGRIATLEDALQKAKTVRRLPFLKQYGDLDKILTTLKAPLDNQSFDMKCITKGCGLSVSFRSQCLNQSVNFFIKMDKNETKDVSEVSLTQIQQHSGPVESFDNSYRHLSHGKTRSPLRRSPRRMSPRRMSPRRRPESRCPSPNPKRNLCKTSSADDTTDDIIIEEVINTVEEFVAPPTGPELANDAHRSRCKRSWNLSGKRKNVAPWVVVTHVVNPTHFYVCSWAEKRESDVLSKKINTFCNQNISFFSATDEVQAGSLILAKGNSGLWCRTKVLEVFQNGHGSSVQFCPVDQLTGVSIFFVDYGFTNNVNIERICSSTQSSVDAVNNQLRKINPELIHIAPQAIRCSLKDLVPYDLAKGWCREAQVEFCQVVGSGAVEMISYGQDSEALLVDLKKPPMGPSSEIPISIRDHLVFIEVARFYCPMNSSGRPLKYYTAVLPIIHVEYSAVVTHINCLDDFYIQLTDNMETSLLEDKLQQYYNTKSGEDLLVYCPDIGQACVARLGENMWYRVEVIGHAGGQTVEVQYIDLGLKASVFVSDLRKIKDEFFFLPAQAIQCCLSDVLPLAGETWSDACIKRFSSLALDKLFTIMATETSPKTKPLPVKLFESTPNDSPTDIAQVLITERLVCSKDSIKANIVEVPTMEFQPQLSLPGTVKDVKVRVIHIDSPSSFYVHFVKFDSQLKRLTELLKEECELMEPQDVAWKPGMFCAAYINHVWERGLISSQVSADSVAEVKRSDHGNKVKLHVSSLRPLPASLEGSFALECSLTDIRPAGGKPSWTATACDYMRDSLLGALALITIPELTDERPVAVILCTTSLTGESVSTSDCLTYVGLALRKRKPLELTVEKPNESDAQSSDTNVQAIPSLGATPPVYPLPPFLPRPTPRTTMPTEKVKTNLYKAPELPKVGLNHMTVSAVKEDGLIYVRTDAAGILLEQLKVEIQQSMKTLPNQKPYTWKTVKGCAVIGPDMLWYRGQLLEVLGGHVKVQYVDYGLVENIPVVHVYPRLLCQDIPQLCIACQLNTINPVGSSWQQDAVELLNEMLLYRRVDVYILKLPTDPRQPLMVEILLDGMNLNTILCHHKHALIARTAQLVPALSSPVYVSEFWNIDTEGLLGPQMVTLDSFMERSLPEKGKSLTVRVRHLQTPNEVFLWWEDTTQEVVDEKTLEQHLMAINADVHSLLPVTNFPQGGPCLAKYSDGSFYRAKMLDIVCADPVRILIQHVDYGSNDIVATDVLRQMPVELLSFPAQVLKVHVAGFKAPSTRAEGEMLPYSPEWSVKATLAMLELLHGEITATVVEGRPTVRDPSVLLFSQDGHSVFLPLLARGLAQLD